MGDVMGYTDLLSRGASPADVRTFLAEGDTTAITIRIPSNLKDAAAEAASMRGMSFSAFLRGCLIEELAKREARK